MNGNKCAVFGNNRVDSRDKCVSLNRRNHKGLLLKKGGILSKTGLSLKREHFLKILTT